MKRILIILLGFCLLLSACAPVCILPMPNDGGVTASEAPEAAPTAEATPTAEPTPTPDPTAEMQGDLEYFILHGLSDTTLSGDGFTEVGGMFGGSMFVPSRYEERTIETVRKEIGERISHYWEQNLDSLVTITQSLLRSSYTDVKFGNTAVICYKEALKSELSLEDIDVGLAEYYSLIMPFFDSISLVKAYQWTASIDTIWFPDTFIRLEKQDLSIQGNLIYGEGIAKELSDSEYYTDILADDWIVFYNYQEHYLDSTSLTESE